MSGVSSCPRAISMFKTDFGTFDGGSWEKFCQICFKIKYRTDGYQQMIASPGDYGLEGFTRTGLAFQCYCPDTNHSSADLYANQRDKITIDLGKLRTYESDLSKFLNGVQIRTWIFVTPLYSKKDLVSHCLKKAAEYRKLKLSILHKDFDVQIHDAGSYAAELPVAMNGSNNKIEIAPKEIPSDHEIFKWSKQQIDLIQNAVRKHGIRIPTGAKNRDIRIQKATDFNVKHYLLGLDILKTWEASFQDRFERFQKLISQFEDRVTQECLVPTDDTEARLAEISDSLKNTLLTEFEDLDSITIGNLASMVTARWILECPIEFD